MSRNLFNLPDDMIFQSGAQMAPYLVLGNNLRWWYMVKNTKGVARWVLYPYPYRPTMLVEIMEYNRNLQAHKFEKMTEEQLLKELADLKKTLSYFSPLDDEYIKTMSDIAEAKEQLKNTRRTT